MIFSPSGLPPRRKYSAHTMNAAHRGTLHSLSHSPNGRLTTTVIATANQSGILFFTKASLPADPAPNAGRSLLHAGGRPGDDLGSPRGTCPTRGRSALSLIIDYRLTAVSYTHLRAHETVLD